MASNAVDQTRAGRVVGYELEGADFSTIAPNLPQRIVVLGEANTDVQGTLDVSQVEISTAQQAATLYGNGSPLHMALRILKPKFSDGVGGIPVIAIAQLEAVGATSKTMTITVTGAATANVTHNVVVAGRESIDGIGYGVQLVTGDSDSDIATKVGDAITNNLDSPLKVVSVTLGVVTVETKWKGLTAEDVQLSVNNNDNAAGVAYAILDTVAATLTPDVQPALDTFGEQWNTLIVNTYGTVAAVVASLQTFNGIPKTISNPSATGQFQPTIQRPLIAITGSVADDEATFGTTNKDEVTIAIAPAPRSNGMPLEAAANVCVMYAPVAQQTPHLDIGGQLYPDMPTPTDIGPMGIYDNRDTFVKSGSSTVTLTAGKYQMEDFISTYHPDGETPPQHRYVRNRTVDSNVKYTYRLKEVANVLDKAIANDDDVVAVSGVIKPKEWKSDVFDVLDDLARRALIADAAFSKSSLVVNIGVTNPNRFETTFDYKRTAIARVVSTTVRAGFNTQN